MNKLIDADKLREQIAYRGISDYLILQLIDEAPDLSLTWENMRFIIETYLSMTDEAFLSDKEPDWYLTDQSFYTEVLRRFNEQRNKAQ